MRTPVRWGAAVAAVGAALLPAEGAASNGQTPRTPPVFKAEQCLAVVDRSVDPVFHVDFAIPFEDDQLTPDELPDSRRFQFFALCRDHHIGESLPTWVVMDDAQRAVDQGLVEALPPEDEVLGLAVDWSTGHDDVASTCVWAMNSADERLPITCAATEGGIDWDTTGAPAGNYVVRGYNFEPALNLWVERRGVVQVVDGPDEVHPVVSLMFPAVEGEKVYEDDAYEVVGCADGPPGTTVVLSWAKALDLDTDEPGDWTVFAELEAEGEFNVPFSPPPESVQQAVVFRGVAQGPDGRQWVSYAPDRVLVYPGDGQTDPPYKGPGADYCGFYPDEPGDTTTGAGSGSDSDSDSGDSGTGDVGTTGTTSATVGSETGETGASDDGGGGCACAVTGRRGRGWSWSIVLLAAMRRRA